MADGPPPFDWSKLFSKENQPRVIFGIIGVMAVIVVLRMMHVFPDQPFAAPGHPAASQGGGLLSGLLGGNGAAGGSEAVPLQPLDAGQCRSVAPAGWTVVDTNPNGTVFTAASNDRTSIASYGGVAINSGQAQGVYGPQFTSPEALIQYSVGALTNQSAQIAPGPNFGAYQTAQIQAGPYHGYALYYRFYLAPDPGGYGLIMRIALSQGDQKAVGVAGSVAAATRCQAVVIPQPIGNDTDRGAAHGAGASKACEDSGNCDDSDLAGTYNAQLGTGWAHDSLGRNYNVDVTTDWSDNGPDGPGYYAMVGGTREKLQGGLQ